MNNTETLTLLLEADGSGLLGTLAEVGKRLDVLGAVSGGGRAAADHLATRISSSVSPEVGISAGKSGNTFGRSEFGRPDPVLEPLRSLVEECSRYLKEIASKSGQVPRIEVNEL